MNVICTHTLITRHASRTPRHVTFHHLRPVCTHLRNSKVVHMKTICYFLYKTYLKCVSRMQRDVITTLSGCLCKVPDIYIKCPIFM
jgi:hypothetical protein